MLDAKGIRKDFPILERKMNGKRLVYFDSAATTQKPRQVIEAVKEYYEKSNSNVHRAVYRLSGESTEIYEGCRAKAARFINAQKPEEIVFVKNTTEGLNLIASSWGRGLKKGDEIVTTIMEHHSNLLPWQILEKKGVRLKFADIDSDGRLDMENFRRLVTRKTRVVAVTHASNVLGTINPVKEMGKIAKDAGALFVVDGAQSVPHMPVDVRDIGADFLVFSGHKMLGPDGTGIVYGREDVLGKTEPLLVGGGMIKEVKLHSAKWLEPPGRFEAGTPDVAGTAGLSAAFDYLKRIGMENIQNYEMGLTKYFLEKTEGLVKLYGPKVTEGRLAVFSFSLGDIHSHDLATVMDERGIAIRSGHHCAQPLMERLNVVSLSRASLYIYNTKEEIDVFIEALKEAKKVFSL